MHEDVKEKFWSMTGDARGGSQPSPDGKWISFVSDRDGWDHLYVMPAAGGAPVQITKGQFEAWRPSWSPDSTRIAFDSNEGADPGNRHLRVVDGDRRSVACDDRAVTQGARHQHRRRLWSPDGTRLVYQHTDPQNSADLFVDRHHEAGRDAGPADRLDAGRRSIARRWSSRRLVHYAGPDGQQVPACLFVPKNLDRTKKHPAVVWIHGDGVNQNYDGWHVQRNYAVYYSFHQYLLQQGYVVIAPDYRGSIGYGTRVARGRSTWTSAARTAKDAWMAANYLKTLPVRGHRSARRLGPELRRVLHADRGDRSADDCSAPRWTSPASPTTRCITTIRITAAGPRAASARRTSIRRCTRSASPVSHIDRLERPLLVLHGTSDVNVPYLHSVRLIDELLKKGKGGLISFMTYPGEFHYFTREHVLRDAWHRVDDVLRRQSHERSDRDALTLTKPSPRRTGFSSVSSVSSVVASFRVSVRDTLCSCDFSGSRLPRLWPRRSRRRRRSRCASRRPSRR